MAYIFFLGVFMATETKNETAEILCQMYKNVKTGSDSIVNLMPKVKDETLRTEMTRELSRLEGFSSEIGKMLRAEGKRPREEGIVSKLSMKMGMNMNTMMDSTGGHIAEMMMEGYNAGIADMTREIRERENTKASEASLRLAREIVRFQEDSIGKMQRFL